MFLLCLVRVVVICLLLYILGTLFININTMESTATGWGYVIIHLPLITVFSYFPFGFQGRIWDLIVSVPDHCLSFYS